MYVGWSCDMHWGSNWSMASRSFLIHKVHVNVHISLLLNVIIFDLIMVITIAATPPFSLLVNCFHPSTPLLKKMVDLSVLIMDRCLSISSTVCDKLEPRSLARRELQPWQTNPIEVFRRFCRIVAHRIWDLGFLTRALLALLHCPFAYMELRMKYTLLTRTTIYIKHSEPRFSPHELIHWSCISVAFEEFLHDVYHCYTCRALHRHMKYLIDMLRT